MKRRDSTRRTACTVVALLLSTSGADALDCVKASTPLERAICGSPSAAASDVAMVAAFESVWARFDRAGQREFRRAALADQRNWLKKRNGECGALKLNERRVRCAEQQNLARTRILTGRPEAGPGLSRQPVPFFFRGAAEPDQFGREVRVYRFDTPQSDAERLVNKQADEGLRGEPAGFQEGNDASGLQYLESWTLSYGSSRLLSIRIERWEFNGKAHGWDSHRALNLDLTSSSAFSVTTIFDESALAQLTRFCLGSIKPESAKPEAGDDSTRLSKTITSSLSHASSWVFGREGAVVHFGFVDGYAAGYYSCEIPYATLDPLAKRSYR